mgnify:CR=1 FL=1
MLQIESNHHFIIFGVDLRVGLFDGRRGEGGGSSMVELPPGPSLETVWGY